MALRDQRAIWDYFQGEAADSFRGSAKRLEFLAGLVGAVRVLNVGVGDGTFEAAALARGAEVFALDPSEVAIERLNQRLRLGDRAVLGWAQEIPFPDESFDAVVVSEVLEHLDDETLEASLHEVRRVLRPGGRILGTVPARENLAEQMVVCPYCDRRYHRWGHWRSFDTASVRGILEPYFTVREIREKRFVNWATLNWKGRISGLVSLALSRLGVHGAHSSVLFVAVKNAGS